MSRPTREEVLEGLRDLLPLARLNEGALSVLHHAIAYMEGPKEPAGSLQPIKSAETAIEMLLQMRADIGIPSWAASIDLVVTYLEGLPTEKCRRDDRHQLAEEIVGSLLLYGFGDEALCKEAVRITEQALEGW